jgi:hypothetical protein
VLDATRDGKLVARRTSHPIYFGGDTPTGKCTTALDFVSLGPDP